MEMAKIDSIKNTKKIFELAQNLEKISQYVRKQEIINWAKDDINEIYCIQMSLKRKGLLEKAYGVKETIDIKISKKENIEKRIYEIYTIINKELNSWRKVNLDINI